MAFVSTSGYRDSKSLKFAHKQKVPPWYAVLWEAWRILVLQKYAFLSESPNFFLEICLSSMQFNAKSSNFRKLLIVNKTFLLTYVGNSELVSNEYSDIFKALVTLDDLFI